MKHALLLLAACGARPHAPRGATTTDEVTLYRDLALIRQRVEIDVQPAELATVRVKIAAGVDPADVVVVDRGELTVSELRIANTAEPPVDAAVVHAPTGDEDEATPEEPAPPAPTRTTAPRDVEIVVGAPHDGHFALSLAYTTDRIAWDAAYTMTTTAARDRATLRGAIAIRNASGIALHAHTYVVDAELGAWRTRIAEQLGSERTGTAPSTTPIAQPHELGLVDLGDGETRIELLPGDEPRPMRSVLVYDPIGTKLDHGGADPVPDVAIGVDTPAPTRVTESFEIARDERTSTGLPAGPVRLLERRPDGSLGVLGESRLFDAATRVAEVDTVAIGTADGVTGHRERRDYSRDADGKRLSEEFLITLDNARARPVDVVIREHLYRGQNWTLAYVSTQAAAKEGPQQVSLRTTVPAKGTAKVLYVVVYTW